MDANDIRYHKARTNTDTSANGGKLSETAEYSIVGDNANILPDVSPQERITGITRYRKIFVRNMNTANETGFNPRMFLKNPTAAGDIVTLKKATGTDTQGTNAATRHYGAASVNGAAANAGASSFNVTIERNDINPFVTGDTIILMSLNLQEAKYPIVDYEVHENITVSTVGTTVTITLANGDQILKNYVGSATVAICAASVLFPGTDLTTAITNTTVNSAGGSFTFSENTAFGDNQGSIDDVIRLDFSSPTAFSATSTEFGSLGAGNISSDFAPINPVVNRPRFTLKSSGFSGVFAAGDYITFNLKAAAFAVFMVETVPAGITSFKANKASFAVMCDTL